MLRPRCLLAGAFLALVLPLGVVLAVVTPPGQVADEVGHIERATALSEGNILGRRGQALDPDGVTRLAAGVDGDRATALATLGPPPILRKLSADDLARAHRQRWLGKDQFLQIRPLAVYLPLFYAPSAAGIAVARLLGTSPFHALLAGRLVNLLAYSAAGLATLLLTRRGLALMFCTLAVPETISLAASFNQDGLLIAASALAAALASHGPGDRPARFTAAALICAVAIVKLPYLVLAAMLLLPVDEGGWPALRTRAGVIVLVALPVLAWTAYAMQTIAVPMPQFTTYHAGPLWPGAPGAAFDSANAAVQLRVFAADPMRVITLPLRTIATDPWLARQAVGVLGWLAIPLPGWFYAVWAVAISCAIGADGVGRRGDRIAGQAANAGLLVSAALLGALLIYLSQYLVWTRIGADRVAGPQGRYLLPLVPMLALAVPRVAPAGPRLRAALCVPVVVAALVGLTVLPMTIVAAFYLR